MVEFTFVNATAATCNACFQKYLDCQVAPGSSRNYCVKIYSNVNVNRIDANIVAN